MNETRKLQMKVEVLRALDQVAPMAMPETTLRTTLQILITPVPLISEVREALTYLESNHLITGVRGGLDSGVKWTITDSGRAQLAAQ